MLANKRHLQKEALYNYVVFMATPSLIIHWQNFLARHTGGGLVADSIHLICPCDHQTPRFDIWVISISSNLIFFRIHSAVGQGLFNKSRTHRIMLSSLDTCLQYVREMVPSIASHPDGSVHLTILYITHITFLYI